MNIFTKASFLLACLALALVSYQQTFAAESPEVKLMDPELGRAFLGIGYASKEPIADDDPRAAYLVTLVINASAAERAGLMAGDLILSFDNKKVSDIDKNKRVKYFSDYIKSKKTGNKMTMEVLRVKKVITSASTKTFANESDLSQAISTIGAGESMQINVRRDDDKLFITATLGQRRTIDSETLANELKNSKWSSASSPKISQLAKRFYRQLGFNKKYENLIARYRENELWDNGQRLSLFRYTHINPLQTQRIVDDLTSMVEGEYPQPRSPLSQLFTVGREVLDLPQVDYQTLTMTQGNIANISATERITAVLSAALAARNDAFSELSEQQIELLYREAPGLLERFSASLYIGGSGSQEERLLNMEIINAAKLVKLEKLALAAQLLDILSWPEFLDSLRAMFPPRTPTRTAVGVKGEIIAELASPAGQVLIGGYRRNVYEGSFAAIIDLGGDDYYRGKSSLTSRERPLSLVIDIAGNDEYNHTEIASQGSGLLGVGMLYDLEGNDYYAAVRLAQGAAFCGVGVIYDKNGNDRFLSEDFAQGVAFWGIGIVLEKDGDDSYQSNLYAQGVGSVKGFGLLFDDNGNDNYFASGRELSSYGTSGVFKGLSQGVGVGFRGYASGGAGMLLDRGGNDQFRGGNFSQGVGYFYGLGMLVNKGDGNDMYLASRYGQGASAHSAVGVLIDEGGDDSYFGLQGALQGFAWDLGTAWLADKGGNDIYNRRPRAEALASASHNGFAVLIDYQGRDSYNGYPASIGGNTYHGGHSFALFVDAGGGEDSYFPPAANSTVTFSSDNSVRADLPCDLETTLNGAACGDFLDKLKASTQR